MVQYGSKITKNMKMAKIVQNNLGKIIWYSNTFEYFGRIYSFAKISVDFLWATLFGYSFVIFLSCRIYSDIHSSNIYGNEYIRIFFVQKFDIRPTLFCMFLPYKGNFCSKVPSKVINTFFLKVQKYVFCAPIFHPLSEIESKPSAKFFFNKELAFQKFHNILSLTKKIHESS